MKNKKPLVTSETLVSDIKRIKETRSKEEYQKSLNRLSLMFASLFMYVD